MRFQFHALDSAARGVRVLEEMPDIRLARIEGHNGIGKTLAARLLELVSGEQPFAALPRAWGSLVELLGKVDIIIDGLEVGTAVVHFDSESWAGRSQSDCASNPGEVTVAGAAMDWPEFRQLLQIRRIAGDEGLAETLGRTVRERAIAADGTHRTIVKVAETWSHRLDSLRQVCGGVTPALLAETREIDVTTAVALKNARDERDKADAEAAGWAEIVGNVQALRDLRLRAPDLLDSYSQSLNKHHQASERLDELEGHLSGLGVKAIEDQTRRAELRGWARRLDLRETAYTRARLHERQVLGYLRLTDRPDYAWIQKERIELRKRLADAEAQLQTIDLSGTVRTLTIRVSEVLQDVTPAARREIVADLEPPITASQLLEGVRKRRAHLEGVPRPGQAVAIAELISDTNDRLGFLGRLPGIFSITDRKLSNVREAQLKIDALVENSGIDPEARAQLQQELSEQRDRMVSGSAEAVAVLAQLMLLIDAPLPALDDGGSADDESSEEDEALIAAAEGRLEDAVRSILRSSEDVESQLADWEAQCINAIRAEALLPSDKLQSVDDPDSPLDDVNVFAMEACDEANERARIAKAALAAATDVRKSAETALAAIRSAAAVAISQLLSQAGEWTSMRESIDLLLARHNLSSADLDTSDGLLSPKDPGVSGPDVEFRVAAVLEHLSNLAVEVEEAVSVVRDAWGTTRAFLDTETTRLAPRLANADPQTLQVTTISSPEISRLLRRWTEMELETVLSAKSLRVQLFDSADQVEFDLNGLAVQWKTPDGKRRRRPLEAFSSGEQVFAYTRAKLETFRELKRHAQHVVIFLDEFGAFVARDRFSELMLYVQRDVLGEIADQVIVMLPTSSGEGIPAELVGHEIFTGRGYSVVSSEREYAS